MRQFHPILVLVFASALTACSEPNEPVAQAEPPKPKTPVMIIEKSAVGPWTVATYEILEASNGDLTAMLTFDTANARECAKFVNNAEPWLTMCNKSAAQGFGISMWGSLTKTYQDTTIYDGMLTAPDSQDAYRAAFSEAPFDSFNMRMSPAPGDNLNDAQNFVFDAKVGADTTEHLKIEEFREKR